jgi:biopolymer transport protein ExbD
VSSSGGSRRHRTGLLHKAPRNAPELRNDINVTPLVDVCLVLLIIFMVVMPMLTRGKEVRLPQTKSFNQREDLGEQPILSVTLQNGKPVYWFDKDQMAAVGDQTAEAAVKKRAGEELAKLAQKDSELRTIFVKADGKLTFGQVYPALMALHEAGSDGVALGVNELKE